MRKRLTLARFSTVGRFPQNCSYPIGPKVDFLAERFKLSMICSGSPEKAGDCTRWVNVRRGHAIPAVHDRYILSRTAIVVQHTMCRLREKCLMKERNLLNARKYKCKYE
uniref:Uncharacterized protein n=1 Tax=Romanomermis culicivorax TaxID=13658 RepID=A0A915KYV6_ROMCU